MECVAGDTLLHTVTAPDYSHMRQVTQQVRTPPKHQPCSLVHQPCSLVHQPCSLVPYQVGSAIAHFHALGIIHRDINPKNVIMSHSPPAAAAAGEEAATAGVCVTLVDFGQACVLPEAGIALSVENVIGGGFIGYRSPEMMKGEPHSYPVDFFSLGCLLHFMLTGSPLYRTTEAERQGIRTVEAHLAQAVDPGAAAMMEELLVEYPSRRGGLESVRGSK
jgi:serine/threonine protein kinase